MKKTLCFTTLFVLISISTYTCPRLPNQSHYYANTPIQIKNTPTLGLMTEDIFNQAMNKVEEVYKRELAPLGINFYVKKDYASNYQNAHPGRDGSDWFIEMFGGLFRNVAYETYEAAIGVACHEVGHHLGETAYYSSPWDWASAEGQSDYFSTSKCLRKVFADDDNIDWVLKYPLELPAEVVSSCSNVWSSDEDRAICIRSTIASYHWIYNFGTNISFSSFDKKIVSETKIYHPNGQCRLDTSFQGALCDIDASVSTLIGDELEGNCHVLTHSIGLRPTCWYKDPNS